MKPLLILSCLIVLVSTVHDITPLSADTASVSKPVVLIIAQSRKAPEKDREKRFITQTMLSLEEFRIITIDNYQHDFSVMPFSKRLEVIRPVAETQGAVATIWIEETSENLTLLHLVAFSTGRALVRIVEARTGPDAALELALAAEELLGQAYLLTEHRDDAIETVVTQVTKNAVSTLKAPEKVIAPGKKRYPAFSILPFAAVEGGVWDYDGNPVRFGGGVALELFGMENLRARTAVLFLSGLNSTDPYGTVYPFGVNIELGVGYLFDIKRFHIGPALAISALWNKLNVNLKTTGDHAFDWWGMSLAAAVDMRFTLTEKLSLLLEPAVAFCPRNKQFYLEPEQVTIYQSPRVSWGAKLGLNVFL